VNDHSAEAATQAAIGRSMLFSPIVLRGRRLANRVVMAPMTRRKAADDGIPTAAMAAYYARRAAGGVGLIVSEGVAIDDRHAFDTRTVPRMVTPQQIEGWRRVVEAVHAEGGAFATQLWHTGRLAADPIGPSQEPPREHRGRMRPAVRAMKDEDFAQVLEAYRHAAAASAAIGCDAVEIHGAHGYLLDSFLDERLNSRDDGWGGDATRRMAFPLAVARAVRTAIGQATPLIYRFSQWRTDDYQSSKWRSPSDLAIWVEALRTAGVDVLHVSTRRATDVAFEEHPQRTLAGWTRRLSSLPTIAVGSVGLHRAGQGPDAPFVVADPSPELALLARGEADMLAVGRMLIANPTWPHLVRDGVEEQLVPYDTQMLATLD